MQVLDHISNAVKYKTCAMLSYIKTAISFADVPVVHISIFDYYLFLSEICLYTTGITKKKMPKSTA
jgi:hypothetical protein